MKPTFMKRILPIPIVAMVVAVARRRSAQTTTPTAAVPVTLDEAIAQGLANSQRLAEIEARVDAAGFVVKQRSDRRSSGRGVARRLHPDESRRRVRDHFPLRPSQVVYPTSPTTTAPGSIFVADLHVRPRRRARARRAGGEERRRRGARDARGAICASKSRARSGRWSPRVRPSRCLARSLEAINAQVRDLRSRFSSGLIPPNDVSSAEAQASRQQVLAIEAANARGIAEADLRRLTGIETAGRLEPRENLTLPAQTPDASTTRPRRGADCDSTEDAARAARVRAAGVVGRGSREASRASARPQVALGAGYDYARPNPRIFPQKRRLEDVMGRLASIVSWSLWDSGRRRAEQGEALATARVASRARRRLRSPGRPSRSASGRWSSTRAAPPSPPPTTRSAPLSRPSASSASVTASGWRRRPTCSTRRWRACRPSSIAPARSRTSGWPRRSCSARWGARRRFHGGIGQPRRSSCAIWSRDSASSSPSTT